MSEKMQETIADIVAEMRRYSDFVIVGNNYCNRIEAAHRRDVDRLNSCIQATVGRSDAEIDRLRREITELKKKVGNAAKMYEALCEIAKRIENICGSDECDDREISKIGALIKQTLAETPRNCDVYTADELKVIFNSELVLELPIANEHEKNLVTITAMGVIDTLFATTRDMLPRSETILRQGLITRPGAEGKGWDDRKETAKEEWK